MPDLVELSTPRLRLRRWLPTDRAPFAALNSDPVVMEHFPATLTPAQSDEFVDRIEARFDRDGYGLWAVELIETAEFIGFVGFSPLVDMPFAADGPEIGWRLARRFWRRGFASEAALEAIRWGFTQGRFVEIVSFTAATNSASEAVMRSIGMTRDPAEDFDHPRVPAGHRLARHVLYRLRPSGASTSGKPRAHAG